MSKWVAIAAAFTVTVLIAMPDWAGAAERKAAGLRQTEDVEVSAARRHRRVKVTVRRYYYYPHPSDLYSYTRPYFVPGPPKHAAGFRRDGFGLGAYGYGYQ
jgi:hypothetical protein